MENYKKTVLPFVVGLTVSCILYGIFRWWAFLILFPWIGFSISVGVFLRQYLKGKKKLIGRKISLLMILPSLLFFIPLVNNENFQLEGVFMIVLVGFFSKGFIHYSVAKIFGPLVWRRGFCGFACWTAAVLDWLPIQKTSNVISRKYRNIRFLSLFLSLLIPVYLIFALSYDPWTEYINKEEMKWMFVSNGVYYAIAVPLAFITSDKRAFCKYVCPVSLVMKPASFISILKIKPNKQADCISCGACNKHCPMGVDIMDCMKKDVVVADTECILCSDCRTVCPVDKIK